MKKVKLVSFNWRQVGSTIDRDGAGEDYERYEIGKNGVKSITENQPRNGMELWNYEIEMEDGRSFRVFNPNFVEYFKPIEFQ